MPTPGSIVLNVENEVTYNDKTAPLVGVYAGLDGWYWDRNRYSAEPLFSTRVTTTLGAEIDGLLDGTALTDWQSGVVSGIEWDSLRRWVVDDYIHWTPVYTVGSYSTHWDVRNLYSDYSLAQNLDPSVLNGQSLVQLVLDDNARYGNLSARIYSRENGNRLTYREVSFVDTFTGELSGGTRLPTGDPGAWLTANFSSYYYEMTIDDDDSLVFNQDPSIYIGADTLDPDSIRATWHSAGTVNAGQDIYLNYFPLDFSTCRLVTITPGDVVTEYTAVRHFGGSTSSDTHFAVNADLSIITIGGEQAPDLILAEGILAGDTEIPVLTTEEEFSQWPDAGVILIGTEEIRYFGKERRSFVNCVRGYNATVPAAYPPLEEITHISTAVAPAADEEVYVLYTAVPRVEYEVTDYDLRTANGSWLNIHPLRFGVPQKITQIFTGDLNIASIELEADTRSLGGVYYGPVFYGTDSIRVTATAYDAAGRRVDDVDITIEIIDGPGTLNGSGQDFTNTSNADGQVFCLFNSPFAQGDIETNVLNVAHSGPDTLLEVPDADDVNLSDVWVYQVVKHDPVTGTVGKEVDVEAFNVVAGPRGAVANFELNINHTEDFGPGSVIVVLGDDMVIRRYNVLYDVEGPNTSTISMSYGVDSTTDPVLGLGSVAWILGPEDLEYEEGRGTKLILYRWYTGGEYEHPVTGNPASGLEPVAAPLQPSSYNGTEFVMPGVNLPLPDPDDRTNNIAGYTTIFPKSATLRATATDPFSGETIFSNEIYLELDLPAQMVGVDSSGLLPIPYGWRLPTEDVNVSSAMGGANFITINPAITEINRFTLRGAF